jgi:hypothetical protein
MTTTTPARAASAMHIRLPTDHDLRICHYKKYVERANVRLCCITGGTQQRRDPLSTAGATLSQGFGVWAFGAGSTTGRRRIAGRQTSAFTEDRRAGFGAHPSRNVLPCRAGAA